MEMARRKKGAENKLMLSKERTIFFKKKKDIGVIMIDVLSEYINLTVSSPLHQCNLEGFPEWVGYILVDHWW